MLFLIHYKSCHSWTATLHDHCVKCTITTFVILLLQDVTGCVCVNPGRLTKGQVGGTFGRLLIRRSGRSEDEKRTSPCLAAQVVRI